MKLARIAIALITVFALTVGAGTVIAAPQDKIAICHNVVLGEDLDDDGDPDEAFGTTILVSEKAVSAHLGHGDLPVDLFANGLGCSAESLDIDGVTGAWVTFDVDDDGDGETIHERTGRV